MTFFLVVTADNQGYMVQLSVRALPNFFFNLQAMTSVKWSVCRGVLVLGQVCESLVAPLGKLQQLQRNSFYNFF